MKQVKIPVDKIQIKSKSFKTYGISPLVAKGTFTIDYTGYHSAPEAIHLNGSMSTKRISEQLPLGYQL